MKIVNAIAALCSIVALAFSIWWAYVTAASGDQHKIIAFFLAVAVFVMAVYICAIWYRFSGVNLPRQQRAQTDDLVIHSAVYGTGPENDRDVTAVLQKKERAALALDVNNNTFGVDPAIGKWKRLKVEYSYRNPVRIETSRQENSRLVLPEDSEIQRLRVEAERLKTSTAKQSGATVAQIEMAGIIKSQAGQAQYLARELERIWHIYNNDHDPLAYPLGQNSLPDTPQLHRHKELWKFRVQYRAHIGALKFHQPNFHSEIMDAPYPWNVSYFDLLQKLKQHSDKLRQLADSPESLVIQQH